MQVSPGRLLVLVLFVAACNLQGEPQVAFQAPAGAVAETQLAALTNSKARWALKDGVWQHTGLLQA